MEFPMTWFTCPACRQPTPSGVGPCTNPGCVANPAIPAEVREQWHRNGLAAAQQLAEDAQRRAGWALSLRRTS